MNKDNQPQSETEQNKLARRKIIKGIAAGVPAVMTLSNGAAQAATSFQRCALAEGNPLDPNDPEYDLNTNSADGQPADTGAGESNDLSCVDINDSALGTPSSPLSPANTYYDKGPGTALRQRVSYPPDGDDGDKACVVFAQDDGSGGVEADVSFGLNSGSAPVTASCYVSFT